MRPLINGTLAAFFAIGLVLPAEAQDRPRPERPASGGTTLTGKERLGRKWMDEQRIDNSNVPLDKRGSRPRPSACPHVPMG